MHGVFLLLIILAPALGFALLGLFGRSFKEPLPGVIASALVLVSFLLGLVLLAQGGASWSLPNWLPGISLSFRLDHLAGFMVLIVSGIGFLIHVYAIGYMHGDEGYSRFFAYFNLFIAMMLILVLANAYPILFIGWEGVGLASYLLIGFWYGERVNADSARKAFIVNRIGDLGFLLGMAWLYTHFGTLSISGLEARIQGASALPAGLWVAALLLLVGAIGKSAQVPLMVWLPDAMAGPTPVSALIHAATMVTAGVYLLARSSFIYANTPSISLLIAILGLITAAYGALSAFGQWDIKRVVAYSTISQLGYMFLAVGVGAYWIALFHVLTHAFFKALLFLSSGSVIHALGGEQDMRKMGGMRRFLPQTSLQALIGALSLSGFPLLAGFWSKDAILSAAFPVHFLLYFGGLLVALLTALYAMRWYVLVFLGQYRGSVHPHEAPPVMTLPNWILAVGAVFAGFLGLPRPLPNLLRPFLDANLALVSRPRVGEGTEWGLLLLSGLLALAALAVGLRFYQRSDLPRWYLAFQEASGQSFYVDALYNALLVRPAKVLANLLWAGDGGLLESFFGGLARGIGGLGGWLARLESGYLRTYAAGLILAAAVLLLLGVLR